MSFCVFGRLHGCLISCFCVGLRSVVSLLDQVLAGLCCGALSVAYVRVLVLWFA